jgi:hypothetical protein
MSSKASTPRASKDPGGRPSKCTLALVEAICEGIEGGKSLVEVCSQRGMPHRATVHRWLRDDVEGFRDRCARARGPGRHAGARNPGNRR